MKEWIDDNLGLLTGAGLLVLFIVGCYFFLVTGAAARKECEQRGGWWTGSECWPDRRQP